MWLTSARTKGKYATNQWQKLMFPSHISLRIIGSWNNERLLSAASTSPTMLSRLSFIGRKSVTSSAAIRNAAMRLTTETKSSVATMDIFNPTEEHAALRQMLRSFVENEVDPQALEHNRKELFNINLFRKLGDLGLLGITVEPEYGGSGMDATAAVIAHGTH